MLRKIMNGSYAVLVLFFATGVVMSCGGGAGGGGNSSNPTYTLSGTVSGAVPQGVTITLSGAGSGTTTTSAGGTYSFTGLSNGYYTVTATRANYAFSPASQVVAVNYANAAAANIVSVFENTYSISGKITQGSGSLIEGVTVIVSSTTSTTSISTTTDATGNYTFSGVLNGDYTVRPVSFHIGSSNNTLTTYWYVFSPTSQAITINGSDLTVADFIENENIVY